MEGLFPFCAIALVLEGGPACLLLEVLVPLFLGATPFFSLTQGALVELRGVYMVVSLLEVDVVLSF